MPESLDHGSLSVLFGNTLWHTILSVLFGVGCGKDYSDSDFQRRISINPGS
jgi:hypothetical protein